MTEQVNTFEGDNSQAPEGHDEAMLAKAEQLEQSNGPDRPDWLPEKFKSVEDMAKAYSELERKLGSGEEQEDNTQEQPKEDLPSTNADATEVANVLDSAGLDFNKFQEEYNETGSLTDDAYTALEEAGFPKTLVDTWIAGQQALAQDATQAVFEVVGGQEQYGEIVQWASQNLSPQEVSAFNRTIDSGDPAAMKLAVEGLSARYRSVEGSAPKLMQGNSTPSTSGAFQSVAELTAAMRDPRYNADPAYRQTVTEKLARSNVL